MPELVRGRSASPNRKKTKKSSKTLVRRWISTHKKLGQMIDDAYENGELGKALKIAKKSKKHFAVLDQLKRDGAIGYYTVSAIRKSRGRMDNHCRVYSHEEIKKQAKLLMKREQNVREELENTLPTQFAMLEKDQPDALEDYIDEMLEEDLTVSEIADAVSNHFNMRNMVLTPPS